MKSIRQYSGLFITGCIVLSIILIDACQKGDPVSFRTVVGVGSDVPIETKIVKIDATGGTVELSNGTRIIIPAGALGDTTEITLRLRDAKYYFAGDGKHSFSIECTPEGQSFTKTVEFYIPFPSDLQDKSNLKGLGGVIDPATGALEVIPSSVVSTNGKNELLFKATHFSKYGGYFGETPPPQAGPLEIPYFNQGSSQFCWATCLQMLFEAIKHDEIEEIADIIGYMNVNEGGLGQYEFRYGPKANSIVKIRTDANSDRQLWPKGSAYAMDSYLRDRIALGYPVLVFTPVEEHAFTVVGYDGNNFMIHDPATLNKDQIGYTKKSWSNFRVGDMDVSAKFVTLSIAKEITRTGIVTLNIGPGPQGEGVCFVRPNPKFPRGEEFRYDWDYKKTKGYSFKDMAGVALDSIPGDVTELKIAEIQLANSSRTQTKQVNVSINIDAQNNSKKHSNFPSEQSITLPPNSFRIYKKTIAVKDFADTSLTATQYRMNVRVIEAGGSLLDDASIDFKIGPPSPLRVEIAYRIGVEKKDPWWYYAKDGDLEYSGKMAKYRGAWSGTTFTVNYDSTTEWGTEHYQFTFKVNTAYTKLETFSIKRSINNKVERELSGGVATLKLVSKQYVCHEIGALVFTVVKNAWFEGYNDTGQYFCDETCYFKIILPKP